MIEAERRRRVAIGEIPDIGAANAGPQPLVQYQRDPLGFCVDILGVPRHTMMWGENPGYLNHEWDGTPEPLFKAMMALADGKNVAIEAATGTQKSYTAACLVYWFLGSWESRVGTYAPRESQLTQAMWAEMGRLFPAFQRHFPTATMTHLKLVVDSTRDAAGQLLWSCVGKPVQLRAGEENATAAQGFHAKHMLLVLEETPGIMPPVVNALEATMSDEHNLMLALGNPDAQTDTLHGLAERPSWTAIRISSLDHPNVVTGRSIVPGACSIHSVQRLAEKYTVKDVRSLDAPSMFKSRVRGLVPDQSTEALIRLVWVEAAQARQKAWIDEHGSLQQAVDAMLEQRWPWAMGVDPSQSEDGDLAGQVRMLGPYTTHCTAKPCVNATDLGTDVWAIIRANDIAIDCVGVDPIGLGAATVNEIRRKQAEMFKAEPRNPRWALFLPRIEGGGKALKRIARVGENVDAFESDANLFGNLRAQMYWQAMLDLQAGRVGLPPMNATLARELTDVRWEKSGGKVWIEDKDEIRKRTGKSPNEADAWVYANWVRSRETPIDHGQPMPEDRAASFSTMAKTGRKVQPQDRSTPTTAPLPVPAVVTPYWMRK